MDNAKLQQIRELYHFNGFRLNSAERRLWFEDTPVALKPKQFDLLYFFVQNAGRTMTKDELLNAVWGDTFVEETTLARNVSWLRNVLGKFANGESIIETVPKLGYRFTPPVTVFEPDEDTIIIEKQTIRHFRGEEIITFDGDLAEINGETEKPVKDERVLTKTSSPSRLSVSWFSPALLLGAIAFIALVGIGAVLYPNILKTDSAASGSNNTQSKKGRYIPANANIIKIGSIVNLQNRYPNDGSYLDAWGAVWSKPEFDRVPTETMFVSTHKNPNRENGTGSWQIVSAIGKETGEPLVVGDRIHLKNMFPNAGYLDACGWIEHLPVFKNYSDHVGAVFTTKTADRDDGTGVWIVRSATEENGAPVLEGDSIAIESSYFINDGEKNRITGFLDVTGEVKELPAFNDYDGSKLVFTKNILYNEPVIDIWTITLSKTFLK